VKIRKGKFETGKMGALGQVDAEMDVGLDGFLEEIRDGVGGSEGQLVEEGSLGKSEGEALKSGKFLGGLAGEMMGRLGRLGEAFIALGESGGTREGGEECLVGADIGSGLILSDMLFPGG
jgi:hypothetical protein